MTVTVSNRAEQIVPAALILALSVAVTWVSYTAEPAGAFLFPRLISTVMVVLAIINFARAAMGLAQRVPGLDRELLSNMAGGVIVLLIAVFWAAKTVGFYTTALVTFFLLATLYAPDRFGSAKTVLTRAAISVAFVAVLYGLFALLLKVQTPRGILM